MSSSHGAAGSILQRNSPYKSGGGNGAGQVLHADANATGLDADPVISWAGITLRLQPTIANGGAYIESLTIEVIP